MIEQLDSNQCTGYVEGYYGRLLDWSDRARLLQRLHRYGMSHYFYAPKEDTYHRLHWREPYQDAWRNSFRTFCQSATQLRVTTVAGIAPGLDFDFSHLPGGSISSSATQGASNDLALLLDKAHLLREDGADVIALLLDDIDEDFHLRSGSFVSEGNAHAALANHLGEALDADLWVVPRVYADEIAQQSPEYLNDFCAELNACHSIVYCGKSIVSRELSTRAIANKLQVSHPIVVWDNLYANDYCPRRLFLGPFTGREEAQSLLINPTGMIETDCLLLDIMHHTLRIGDPVQAWQQALVKYDLPDAFFCVAPYLNQPAFDGVAEPQMSENNVAALAAIETLLWKWKSPLSREWYPILMGLKQDLLLAQGQLPRDRIHKTQMSPLATVLAATLDNPGGGGDT